MNGKSRVALKGNAGDMGTDFVEPYHLDTGWTRRSRTLDKRDAILRRSSRAHGAFDET